MAKKKKERVNRQSADLTKERFEALTSIIPEAFVEGKVDCDKLKEALGDFFEERKERYTFTWAGKSDAIRILQTPSRATLKPCPEESLDWEITGNLFIEGDNLEVLKLLYKTYFGRVKMIYIDPPYNTGNDFIYPDNYADPLDTYLKITGQKDQEGNLLTSNPETSGRYHSAWLTMMYPRLFLARQLLSDDGVIFISIDDHESHNLRMIMNEIFGEENFLCNLAWEKRYSPPPDTKDFGYLHESVLVYRKSERFVRYLLPLTDEQKERYKNPDNDPRGPWKPMDYTCRYTAAERPNLYYGIKNPNTREEVWPKKSRVWAFSKAEHKNNERENAIWWGMDGQNKVPAYKNFLSQIQKGMMPGSILKSDLVGHTDEATKELRELIPGLKTNPKPTRLIRHFLQIVGDDNIIILDFFAGSCTAAHAVINLNNEDGGHRRYIMVQLQEPTDNDELPTIAEIGKERIRRVVDKIREANEGTLPTNDEGTIQDLGFRVFKLDKSNYRPWADVPADEIGNYPKKLEAFEDPLLPDWRPEDVIWEVAIKEGLSLSSLIERNELAGHEVYTVKGPDTGQVVRICLDEKLDKKFVKELAPGKEDIFICRDIALSDELAANLALQCRLKTI